MLVPPILPKQSAPVSDSAGRFLDAWYLYFGLLTEAASTAAGIVQYGASADRQTAAVEGLTDGTLWIETDTGLIYQWEAPSLVWLYVSGTQIISQTLAASTTTINAPKTGARELVVILTQDATGGRAVVWGTGFAHSSVSLGQALASTVSTFRFVLVSGSYIQIGQQTVDMT